MENTQELLLGLALKIPVVIAVMHLGEWTIHKYILHGKWLLRWKLTEYIPRQHAIEHHGNGINEPQHINLSVIDYWATLPFIAIAGVRYFVYGQVSGLSSMLAIVACCLMHLVLWNKLHRAIHGIEPHNWTTKLPLYKLFKAHHDGHHKRTNRNYGIVFIGVDRWMGTRFTDTAGRS